MKRTTAVVAVLLLCGCSTTPLVFSPPPVAQSITKHNAALVSSVVTLAPKGEATGPILIAGGEADIAGLWKSAVDEALLRSAAFNDDATTKLTLVVKVYQLNYKGLGYKVNAAARYELVDRSSGKPVYSQMVITQGSANDFVGNNRVRNGASQAVSQNIAKFLNSLDSTQF